MDHRILARVLQENYNISQRKRIKLEGQREILDEKKNKEKEKFCRESKVESKIQIIRKKKCCEKIQR